VLEWRSWRLLCALSERAPASLPVSQSEIPACSVPAARAQTTQATRESAASAQRDAELEARRAWQLNHGLVLR
jgi:hypothetical protein